MKRKILIATVAAAALVGGGTYTAVAASGDDPAPSSKITASEAAGAALAKSPGAVESVDLDDDGDRAWHVDVLGKDNRTHEVKVDAKTGGASVSQQTDDDGRDDAEDASERAALRTAKVDAAAAGAAALELRPGTVTEAEFDDGRWEVEVRGTDGRSHDVHVDAKTGKATASADTSDDTSDKASDDGAKDSDGSDD